MSIRKISSKIQHVRNLASWLPSAQTIDTIDSPFLFELINEVVWKDQKNSTIAAIEERRQQFLHNHSLVQLEDYEEGSLQEGGGSRKISDICKSAVSSQEKCLLLHNLTRYLQPKSILELGTSLGICTLYLAAACPESDLTTLEGDLALMGIAANHSMAWAQQIEYLSGTFEQSLNHLVSNQRKYDLIYIDVLHSANGQSDLLSYYNSLSDENVIWIVDDIYWSKETTRWWNELKSNRRWNVAIDFYHFGLLCNNPNLKEAIDTKLLPKKIRWKPGLVRD